MKTLEELKKKIQESVPEIMELGFGCKISFNTKMNIGGEKWDERSYATILNIVPDLGFTILHENNHIELFLAFLYIKKFKILGRPITLEDVLVALGERTDLEYEWDKDNNGKICFVIRQTKYECQEESTIAYIRWQLNKTLDQQSEECWEFLNKIL